MKKSAGYIYAKVSEGSRSVPGSSVCPGPVSLLPDVTQVDMASQEGAPAALLLRTGWAPQLHGVPWSIATF